MAIIQTLDKLKEKSMDKPDWWPENPFDKNRQSSAWQAWQAADRQMWEAVKKNMKQELEVKCKFGGKHSFLSPLCDCMRR